MRRVNPSGICGLIPDVCGDDLRRSQKWTGRPAGNLDLPGHPCGGLALFGSSQPAAGRCSGKIQEEQAVISPAVVLELEFLREIKRLTIRPEKLLHYLKREIGLEILDEGFAKIVEAAKSLDWTRDPFDRLIVGQARASRLGLITKDRQIRRHFDGAFWGQ